MKIAGITTRVLEFDATPRFGNKPIPPDRSKTWRYPLIIVHTDEGLDGYSMCYGPHGDGPAMAEILRDVFFPEIAGENPLHPEVLWKNLMRKNRHMYNLSDALVGVLDVAFWDIKGKALGASIVDLLGPHRDKIKTYATGQVYLPDEQEVYDEAKNMKQAGYHGYKLQLWQGPDVDIPRFHAAREAVGDGFPLMQDAVGGYTYAEALKVGRVLEELHFTWFEEPIPDRQLGLLQRLDDELDIPLLVGETLSLGELSQVISLSFKYVRGDVLIKGGITGLQKAFEMSELAGANLEIHTANAPLLDVANLHVACANKNCEYLELHHPIFRFGLKNSPLEADSRGYLHVPERPGLGVDLDWDWIDEHTIEKISI